MGESLALSRVGPFSSLFRMSAIPRQATDWYGTPDSPGSIRTPATGDGRRHGIQKEYPEAVKSQRTSRARAAPLTGEQVSLRLLDPVFLGFEPLSSLSSLELISLSTVEWVLGGKDCPVRRPRVEL